jgi:hypothetical protein
VPAAAGRLSREGEFVFVAPYDSRRESRYSGRGMPVVERIGNETTNGRSLFVLELAEPEDLPAEITLANPRFVCLVAWHASAVDGARVARMARALLDSGAVYVCTSVRIASVSTRSSTWNTSARSRRRNRTIS